MIIIQVIQSQGTHCRPKVGRLSVHGSNNCRKEVSVTSWVPPYLSLEWLLAV